MRQKGADMTKSNKPKSYVKFPVAVLVCLLFIAAAFAVYRCYKYDYSGVPDAVSSSGNGTECSLIVTANASRIQEREALAEKIFEMCRTNSFQSIKLSTDKGGWPSRLKVTVYLHRYDVGRGEPEMRIRFVPPEDGERYNIRDDGEKYRTFIE